MIITKSVGLRKVLQWSGHHIVWLTLVMAVAAALYFFEIITFSIPWLPISVIGTAVAFYVGFKNSQSYDRMWEARKIWGGIVNDSRTWGMMVDGFVSNLFAEQKVLESEIDGVKKRLIYRHIGWLYAHRSQLLLPTSWEHISQGGHMTRTAEFYQRTFGIGLVDDEVTKIELQHFLPEGEYERLINYKNTATQIINEQSRDLQQLRKRGLIEDFRHMELANLLKSFYTLQGKNERIKKISAAPAIRQYESLLRGHFYRAFAL
ncbi:MAG TPA: bestrophin family ion channel [Saprospiraceae bacterium]|nr:bestrophin family ion channel [Saprospiraceae bacterium]